MIHKLILYVCMYIYNIFYLFIEISLYCVLKFNLILSYHSNQINYHFETILIMHLMLKRVLIIYKNDYQDTCFNK